MHPPVYVIHVFIIVAVLCIPLLPLPVLRVGIFVPWVMALLWVRFDGCPLVRVWPESSVQHEEKVQSWMSCFFACDITPSQVQHTITLFLLTIVCASHLRLVNSGLPPVFVSP